jgi:hypothetical protein
MNYVFVLESNAVLKLRQYRLKCKISEYSIAFFGQKKQIGQILKSDEERY